MKKRFLRHVVSDVFDVPLEGIASVPNVQIIGNNIVNVEGCKSVKKYDKEEIILKSSIHQLTIKGKELSMTNFSEGRVSIRGVVSSYEILEC